MTRGAPAAKRETSNEAKIRGTTSNWESGKLGLDEEHAVPATAEHMIALDDALGLKPISIRLQVSLIQKLKLIARFHGIGYQPLVRDLLNRFVSHELVDIAHKLQKQEAAEEALSDSDSPAAKYMKKCA